MDFANLIPQKICTKNKVNNSSDVYLYNGVSGDDYSFACDKLEKEGYTIYESRSFGNAHFYRAYSKADAGVFVNFFKNTASMTIVKEESCRYFSFTDTLGDNICSPSLTQMKLKDYGMSYVVRLMDGRYIILDGGREFEEDADRLFEFLKNDSSNTPQIAAWILTHPHDDHYRCFVTFYDKYCDCVKIEKFLYNFPDKDDTEHYPALIKGRPGVDNSSAQDLIPVIEERIAQSGADVYMLQTGQAYNIGGATLEIIGGISDTINLSRNINSISVVIKMQIAGQTILFGTDSVFRDLRLGVKYGEYLKSDIIQLPHHGLGHGVQGEEINEYSYIRPETCFMSHASLSGNMMLRAFKSDLEYLVKEVGVKEILSGEATRSVTLPYTPNPNKQTECQKAFDLGKRSAGANVWTFMGMNTGCTEDLEFNVLNVVASSPKINVDVYFENRAQNISYSVVFKSALCFGRLNILDIGANDEQFAFKPEVISKPIPENTEFSVRFVSDTPVFISNKNHTDIYHS